MLADLQRRFLLALPMRFLLMLLRDARPAACSDESRHHASCLRSPPADR